MDSQLLLSFLGAVVGGGLGSALVSETLRDKHARHERREARQAEKQYAVMEQLQSELSNLVAAAQRIWHFESLRFSDPGGDPSGPGAEIDKAWTDFLASGAIVNTMRERLLNPTLADDVAEVQSLAHLTATFLHGRGFYQDQPERPVAMLDVRRIVVNAQLGRAIANYEQSLAAADRWWFRKRFGK